MNQQKTAVLVDSACDIHKEAREQLGIWLLPLRVIYPEKDYQDGVDIDPMMVYQRFPAEFPSTSTPSIAEVSAILDEIQKAGYEHVLSFSISSALSGTYNTIRLVASERKDLDVITIDTKNISCGSGLVAIWAAKRLQEGRSLAWIQENIPQMIKNVNVFFYMDTLEYLQRGGRIGRLSSLVGGALHIKPIISCDDNGTYVTVAKTRGTRQARQRLIEEVLKYSSGHKSWMVVEEGGAHEEAQLVQKTLEEQAKDAQILFEQQIVATMAINTGPGLAGVGVLLDPA